MQEATNTKRRIINDIDFSQFAGGGLAEKLAIEMDRVMANLADPNTPFNLKRGITITIGFSTDEQRQILNVESNVTSKLAPNKALTTKMIMGKAIEGVPQVTELASHRPATSTLIQATSGGFNQAQK